MQYQITSDNIEISKSMTALAKEKFEKIEKRLTEKEKEEAIVRMVLNKSQSKEEEFDVTVELTYGGKKYFAENSNFLLESALISAINEVERMRKKDDISYVEGWKKQRKMKRTMYDIDNVAQDDRFFDDEDNH